jgi:predicted aconitase
VENKEGIFELRSTCIFKIVIKIEFALNKYRTLKSRLLQANPEATVVFLECPYYSITRFNKFKITNSNSKTGTFAAISVANSITLYNHSLANALTGCMPSEYTFQFFL